MLRLYKFLFFSSILFVFACQQYYSPKPRAFYRIVFPAKEYQQFSDPAPYTFEYPVYARVEKDHHRVAGKYWYNIVFDQFNAKLHISYFTFSDDSVYQKYLEDAQTLAFRHTVKASAIDERDIFSKDKKVYGLIYEIDGNAASWYQFYLTDSVKNYLRGALYFNEKPRQDSIQPVLDFIVDDIKHMITTFEWKK